MASPSTALALTRGVVVTSTSLRGSVAVVVGCAQGIGLSSARLLAERGAAVVLADLAGDRAVENARNIVTRGGTAVGVECDVREPESLEQVVAAAVDLFGRLDILHNNAAAMHLLRDDGDALSTDLDVWDEMLHVNLRGQLLVIRAVLPQMLDQRSGAIVNTSSVTGMAGDTMLTAYGTSKAAILHLTKSVATQYGRHGVRCNAVVPGLIRVQRPGGGLSADTLRQHVRQQLLDRVGEPEDIARAVAFLASDEAAFITGQALVVDGGLTSHVSSYADSVDALVRV